MATYQEISQWFDDGKQQEKKYMLIICDTYDYEYYPLYFNSEVDAKDVFNNPGFLQRRMICM